MKDVKAVAVVVAVSGGVDSVVLLDVLVEQWQKKCEGKKLSAEFASIERIFERHLSRAMETVRPPLIVAHFDHGIRGDSADDEEFVSALAARYGATYVSQREELGGSASEELARQRRYTFLRQVAEEHHAVIVAAHHADDVVETVAINIQRGTGWRGLAVMGAHDVVRPLLSWSKQDMYDYALNRRLEWVEDSTNRETIYLRNCVRRVVSGVDGDAVLALRNQQVRIRQEIDDEIARLLPISGEYSRYDFIMTPPEVASELLQAVVARHCATGLTRPQRLQALLAIKTAQPRTKYQAGGGVTLRFTKQYFVVETG